jgi:molybdopterin-dependent oxidoreductase alpha subunit
MAELYGFEPPRWEGMATVDACEGVIDGRVKGFVSLGGNFAHAVPERARMQKAWRGLGLSVQIATKLNRTHLLPGRATYLLPCLGRIDVDRQATGPQAVSVEDSTACIHGSRGKREPIGEHLLSEPAIIAGIAKATLRPNPRLDWDTWVGDYSLVRDAIERTWPDDFKDFNARLFKPGGFPRPLGARQRKWNTDTGKANFVTPRALDNRIEDGAGVYQLMTIRSDGQFNTTIYTIGDRLRGINGTRMVVLMHADDIAAAGLEEGQAIGLETVAGDGIERRVQGLRATSYDIPRGCIAAYYPECNPLIPLWHHAEDSKVPAAKSVPVRLLFPAAPAGD